MNFSVRLNVILEVFDTAYGPDAMTGVTAHRGKGNTIRYTFEDEDDDYLYLVDVVEMDYFWGVYNAEGIAIIGSQPPKKVIKAINELKLPGILTNQYYTIMLGARQEDDYADFYDDDVDDETWDYDDDDDDDEDYPGDMTSDDFSLTNIGNANFVYSKMLACLFDYVDKYGLPAIIAFSSWDKKTVSIYNRLVNMVARVKGYKYLPISKGFYILDKVAEMITPEMKDLGIDVGSLIQKATAGIDAQISRRRTSGI